MAGTFLYNMTGKTVNLYKKVQIEIYLVDICSNLML